MLPSSCFDTALVALAVAVLFNCAHVSKVVGAVTTAVNEVPCASEPTVQFSVCAPTLPATEQPDVAVLQFTPVPPPAGSGSLVGTPVAVPGPLLVTTMVNVAVSPAVIVVPSGAFLIASPGI